MYSRFNVLSFGVHIALVRCEFSVPLNQNKQVLENLKFGLSESAELDRIDVPMKLVKRDALGSNGYSSKKMKPLVATVVNIQEEPDNRYHAAVTLVLPDNIEHVELMLEGISAEADASALSDTDPGTHSIGISGSGKPPFEVGHQIPVRAFERGELPA
jgi:hypothetical protein